MKQYKLKKWYPGCKSVKENDIINVTTFGNNLYKSKESIFFTKSEVENNPEYWEEITEEKIIEKNYEILSFKDSNKFTWTRESENPQASFKSNISVSYATEGILLSRKCNIHSVKRLSDNCVFTVGDDIIYNEIFPTKLKIKSFQIFNGELLVHKDCTMNTNKLSEIQHIKKPLFTTEDGVYIFQGDNYYRVNNYNMSITKLKMPNYFSNSYTNVKFFSTKEAAEKYIDSKKPKLLITTEDGKKLYSNDDMKMLVYGVAIQASVNDEISTKPLHHFIDQKHTNRKWFYDTGNAEEYLLYNKPVLSLMDVAGIYVTANPNIKTPVRYRCQRDRMIKLIKEKIYGKDK